MATFLFSKSGHESMLPPEAIEEFKTIYKEVFDEELDDAEALRRATRLFELYKAILSYSPTDSKKEVNNYEPRSKSK